MSLNTKHENLWTIVNDNDINHIAYIVKSDDLPALLIKNVWNEYIPAYTLDELIAYLGDRFWSLELLDAGWIATSKIIKGNGTTPLDAVYELIIKLQGKK